MALLIFYLFLALFVSFLCSIMEAVILTTPISYLKIKEEDGSYVAKRLIELKQNIDKPLSAILSLNTIAHTIGAAGVGAQATKIFGEVYFGLISAILTIFILIFSEIIPKTIGAGYWRRLVIFVGRLVRITIFLMYPLVVISALFTSILSRKNREKTTSREEISVLANIGEEEGVFERKENKIIQNIIKLKDVKVSEVTTPRIVVSIADEDMGLKDFSKSKLFLHFSRIPVYKDNPENITGYIFRQSVFENISLDKHNLKLKDLKREILIVQGSNVIFSVWEKLLEQKEHIALVVDEYGSMEGIVTMEDIIEALLGLEIIDERDIITNMRQYAREKWNERQEKYKFLDSYNEKS